jgi:hypothetical protein
MSPRMLRENVVEGIHMVDDAYVNWFLVEEGRKLTVVDSGHPSSWKSLQRALSKLGRSVGDIEAVVLTHGHFDHMGFARRAHEELGVPVWAHERETAVARHPWRYDHERSRIPYFARHPGFVRIFTAMGTAGALRVKGLDEVRTYAAGEHLDSPRSTRSPSASGTLSRAAWASTAFRASSSPSARSPRTCAADASATSCCGCPTVTKRWSRSNSMPSRSTSASGTPPGRLPRPHSNSNRGRALR